MNINLCDSVDFQIIQQRVSESCLIKQSNFLGSDQYNWLFSVTYKSKTCFDRC